MPEIKTIKLIFIRLIVEFETSTAFSNISTATVNTLVTEGNLKFEKKIANGSNDKRCD